MIKNYFIDALLQIAIVLSLLKTHHEFSGDHTFNEFINVRDNLRGNLVVSPAADHHLRHRWDSDAGGIVHPKSANVEIEDVLRRVHSLGQYRHFDGIDSGIVNAFLVDETSNVTLSSQGENGSQLAAEEENFDLQINIDDGANKEDMDLINVLWQQDIDLEIMIETPLMWELERGQETSLRKKLEEGTSDLVAQQQLDSYSVNFFSLPSNQDVQEDLNTQVVDGFNGSRIFNNENENISLQSDISPLSSSLHELHSEENQHFSLSRQASLERGWREVMDLLEHETGQLYQNNQDGEEDIQGDMFTNLFHDDLLFDANPLASLFNEESVVQYIDGEDEEQLFTSEDHLSNPVLLQDASLSDFPSRFNQEFTEEQTPMNTFTNSSGDPDNIYLSQDFSHFSVVPESNLTSAMQNELISSYMDDNPFMTDGLTFELLHEDDNHDDGIDLDMDFLGTSNNHLETNLFNTNGTENSGRSHDQNQTMSDQKVKYDLVSSFSPDQFNSLPGAASGGINIKSEMQSDCMSWPSSYDSTSLNTDDQNQFVKVSYSDFSSEPEEDFENFLDNLNSGKSHILADHPYHMIPKPFTKSEPQKPQLSRCKDDKKAKEMKIPFTLDEIIFSSMERFNEMITSQKYGLSSEQKRLMKDIRKRGKNKQAAQNCRKRKTDTIQTLEMEVEGLKNKRTNLLLGNRKMRQSIAQLRETFANLQAEILERVSRKNSGSIEGFTIQVTDVGDVFLVPGDGRRNSIADHYTSGRNDSKKRFGKRD